MTPKFKLIKKLKAKNWAHKIHYRIRGSLAGLLKGELHFAEFHVGSRFDISLCFFSFLCATAKLA